MTEAESLQQDCNALNELVVNCPDLDRLESLLGGFNIFQVLKFEYGEIRHSNVLAWILDPAESHGLDASFLQKWLMRVIYECRNATRAPISAVDIDAWQLLDVEVRREWRNIDLLVVLNFANGSQWVVCIENKIYSTQHSDQLRRYRTRVENAFPQAARRIFLFLTTSEEAPEDECYIPASYAQVHRVLKDCLDARKHSIGSEPRVLLENYLRLLEEKFMDDSEIARTALKIYQQHKRALDVIFEHRPDNLRMVSEKLRRLMAENAATLRIVLEPYSKAYLRFIPVDWDQPGNTHGDAWAGCNRTVLFEVNLTGKRPYLYATSGKAPDAWIDRIWEMSQKPPFRGQKRAVRPKTWCAFHLASRKSLPVEISDIESSDEMAKRIYDWLTNCYLEPDTQEVVKMIATELPRLDDYFKSIQAQ